MGGSVRWGRHAPWALALVLVRPAAAALHVAPAGGGLLLQVEDAVDGALQVLVQGVVWGAAAGETGVIHVGGVRLAAFGGEQGVSCKRGLWGGRPGGVLVHSERPASAVPVFPARPLVFTHASLLVCVLLLPPLLAPLSVEELRVGVREGVVLGAFDAAAEHLVHVVQPLHGAP